MSEAIWATREYENRNYFEVNGIQTSFVKLGRPFGEKRGGRNPVHLLRHPHGKRGAVG